MFIGTDVKVSLDESYNKLSLIEKGEGKFRLLLNKDKGTYNVNLKYLMILLKLFTTKLINFLESFFYTF